MFLEDLNGIEQNGFEGVPFAVPGNLKQESKTLNWNTRKVSSEQMESQEASLNLNWYFT